MSDENNNTSGGNQELIAVIAAVISIIMKYGLPYVLDLLNNIDNNVITKEDIDNLKIKKSPEDYFTE